VLVYCGGGCAGVHSVMQFNVIQCNLNNLSIICRLLGEDDYQLIVGLLWDRKIRL